MTFKQIWQYFPWQRSNHTCTFIYNEIKFSAVFGTFASLLSRRRYGRRTAGRHRFTTANLKPGQLVTLQMQTAIPLTTPVGPLFRPQRAQITSARYMRWHSWWTNKGRLVMWSALRRRRARWHSRTIGPARVLMFSCAELTVRNRRTRMTDKPLWWSIAVVEVVTKKQIFVQ